MDLKAVDVITNMVPLCVVCDASRSVLVDCVQVCLQSDCSHILLLVTIESQNVLPGINHRVACVLFICLYSQWLDCGVAFE